MVDTPRKTFPELQALSAPLVDTDVVAVYRSPGPAKRTTASVLNTYMGVTYANRTASNLTGGQPAAFLSAIGGIGAATTKTWGSGEVGSYISADITNNGASLSSMLIDIEVTGTNARTWQLDGRANLYTTGTVLQMGYQNAPGSGGNIQISAIDPIARGVAWGGGHMVFDGLFARGTPDAPLPALVNDQQVAFACRSWDGTQFVTSGDITWGASQNHGPGETGTDLTLWNCLNLTDDLYAAMRFTGLGVADLFCPLVNNTTVRTGVNFISFLSNPVIGASVNAAGLRHVVVNDPALGSGASISSTHTAFEAPNFTSGTNKIAYRSLMAAAADKWDLFFGGGAQSYIEGSLGIGINTPTVKLDVVGAIKSSSRITGLILRTENYIEFNNLININSTVDGVLRLTNWADTDFGRLQLGGTTSSFPSIKRTGAGISARLADDSADTFLTTSYVKTAAVAVASLPSAATAGIGARSFVTDALAPVFGATVAAGGAVATPVYSDGTNWKVG
jgi:hypothetical protein